MRVRIQSAPDVPGRYQVIDEHGNEIKYVMTADIHIEATKSSAVLTVFCPEVDIEIDAEVHRIHESDNRSKANA